MLARSPRNLGQWEEFADFFGGATDAFSYDTFDYLNEYTLPDFALDDFVIYEPATFDFNDPALSDFSLSTLEPYDIGVPEIAPALDTVDVETFPLEAAPVIEEWPLPAVEDMAVLSPDQTVFDIEDAEIGAAMEAAPIADAEMRAAVQAARSLPPSPAWPSAATVMETATRIAAAGATIYASKTQADNAATRANLQQSGGATRYRSAIDPATGRAVVVDTVTGKAVTIDPATGLPVQSGFSDALNKASAFVKANAFPLALGGAILTVVLMRSPTVRRYRSKRTDKRGTK